MHIIAIKQNDVGNFDVLINDFDFRVNRNLTIEKAKKRAVEIKSELAKLGERAIIKNQTLD
ncbi:MAG: hypothetical protein RE468_04075 [Acidithiobacillus caldus]|jgi:hypothetical protein|uniref:Uncharacterized protein n=1 Tax=Acidithiobacillus caldus TaxID=33059 RepID=A0A1E7YP20_9PROT|nr:hypothetical protein [Acidithiobacillus caldus]MBU2802243.1 hypothetical protein [Acidithiobacillus caldus]OFC36722.1 hypothetical protein BAE27_05510 [Acidithiobacillus caldus]OFC37406.1 hypothetical protein BAE29_11060 [Acidithiobacillus caldus]OFC40095.1 hypothetical protein BAE30_16670 [Acidithiobacillus caldus]OFC40414.1 hypothetical protein BAE28_00330 [Acidithiobacillus caldus]